MKRLLLLGVLCSVCVLTDGLNNGLALTPPMGWLTWERFRCNTNCAKDPDNCISEWLIKAMADRLVEDGYAAAGYKYITIDDCWPEPERDKDGRLQPDHKRFPSGIKALADYVHSKGLKFGIYEDFGVKTCAGYPGSEFYMQTDANTFAEWGVDLLKFDGCNSDYYDSPYGYPAMEMYLNKTGRPIVYSCEWPLYDRAAKKPSNYTAISETCNFWRNFDDIQDSWDSLKGVIGYYMLNLDNFTEASKPGAWNDPDMLDIGNYGLSHEQERLQMAMWAIFAAPLIMSVDLRTIHPRSKEILLNKRVIAVNQDKLGIQGHLQYTESNYLFVWVRPILPRGSAAVVFSSFAEGGGPTKMTVPFTKLGLTNENGYNVTETFDGKYLGEYKSTANFTCFVNPTGVFMITAIPL